jgi:hypothetical protein
MSTFEDDMEAENRFIVEQHAAGWWERQKDEEIARLRAEVEALRADAQAVAALFPGSYYMDPPDGGDVPIIEQLRRMAADAARYRWLRVQHWDGCRMCVVMAPIKAVKPGSWCPGGLWLDSEIDAARAAQGDKT